MQPLTLRALSTTGLIWGCELALARLTSRQLEVTKVATLLLILIGATLPFIGLASATSHSSLRSSPWRAHLLGAAGFAPLTLVAEGQIAAASTANQHEIAGRDSLGSSRRRTSADLSTLQLRSFARRPCVAPPTPARREACD